MFDRPVYFSESQRQLVRVDEMPMPYARNVYNKLRGEEGFADSILEEALLARLEPSRKELRALLEEHGAASYWTRGRSTTEIRSKFYSLAKDLGVKIKTHKEGEFIQGTVVVKATVRSH